jgi:hypothetical protein
MPSERGKSRARLAGLLLDTLEFGQKRERASEITVVALRVSDSIRDLAIDILESPSSVNALITAWQQSVKLQKRTWDNKIVHGGTVEDNASTIHQKNAARGDFEARVLALYRALDGDVYEKGTKITANVRRTKAPTTGVIAASGRIADHLDHLRRTRLLLDAVIAEDKHIHNRISEKVRKGHNVGDIPQPVQATYMDPNATQLYNAVNIALQRIIQREALWAGRKGSAA